MKQRVFNSIATRNGWVASIALAIVVFASLGATSATAQSQKQKRVTSIRLGTANEGSCVTVVADSALNNYEAYRRGDRFYVEITAANFASGVPNLRGAGFEDVKVQKTAYSSIISFRLQRGTVARVEQRSNRLDVVFSTLEGAENSGGTATNVTVRAQNPSGDLVAGSSPPSSTGSPPDGRDSSPSNPNRIERQSQSTFAPQQSATGSRQGSTGTASQANPAVSSPGANETASPDGTASASEPLLAAVSPGQPTTVEQKPKPAAKGSIDSQDLQVGGLSAGRWLAREWLSVVVAALLLMSLPLLFVVYRRSFNRTRRPNEPLMQLKNPANIELQQEALTRSYGELECRRQEAEVIRKQAEEEAWLKEPYEKQATAEAEGRLRTDEAARRAKEEAAPPLGQEQAHVKAQREIFARSEAEATDRAGEDASFRIEAETLRRAGDDEEQSLLVEAEERRRISKERLKLEQEALMQAAIELTRHRPDVPEARRAQEEEEKRRLAELDVVRVQAEQAQQRAKQERRIRAEIAALRQTEIEQNKRIEVETRRRAAAESRHQAEQEARMRASQEARLHAEEEAFNFPVDREGGEETPPADKSFTGSAAAEKTVAPSQQFPEPVEWIAVAEEKGLARSSEDSSIPSEIFKRLHSDESRERAAALAELAPIGGHNVFSFVSRAFDDESADVRNAAAHALYDMQLDRAASFTRALREGSPERRRRIGAALAASGLANNAINNLTGESREKTYDAFSLLFLMAKAGEVQPLMQAIEEHTNVEVRLAVVKLLALSGQAEIVPAFRRLAVRGSLPSEIRSAVMEAIYQISSQARESAHSLAGA